MNEFLAMLLGVWLCGVDEGVARVSGWLGEEQGGGGGWRDGLRRLGCVSGVEQMSVYGLLMSVWLS